MNVHVKDSTVDNSTEFAAELAELIETYVADRFTIMDDSVLESLYADLPDITYLKGVVKGLRRNLMRQAQEIDLEGAYPKINAGSMQQAMEQAREQLAEKGPLAPPKFIMDGIQDNSDNGEADDDWVDNSTQPAHLLNQDFSQQHRITPIRDIIRQQERQQELRQRGLTERDIRAMTVTKDDLQKLAVPEVKFESRVNENKAPQIDRGFRSNLSRYGIASATLADMTSNARPGGLFSADTLKHSKHQDLLLVRSPVTRPKEPVNLLERTDPQYYQYMYMAFDEALATLINDDELPDNQRRDLDDPMIINRMPESLQSTIALISKIGNRDLLHVETVSEVIRILTEKHPSVKFYTGDKVMEDGRWTKTWTHATLRTPKGRFIFGNPEVNVVWQTN
jgi:hypothetical protein